MTVFREKWTDMSENCTPHENVKETEEDNGCQTKHQGALCEALWRLCVGSVLCDVILQVDDEELPAHCVVLSAGSTLLRQHCFNPALRTANGMIAIRIHSYSYKVCLRAIEFLYTGRPVLASVDGVELAEEFKQFCHDWAIPLKPIQHSVQVVPCSHCSGKHSLPGDKTEQLSISSGGSIQQDFCTDVDQSDNLEGSCSDGDGYIPVCITDEPISSYDEASNNKGSSSPQNVTKHGIQACPYEGRTREEHTLDTPRRSKMKKGQQSRRAICGNGLVRSKSHLLQTLRPDLIRNNLKSHVTDDGHHQPEAENLAENTDEIKGKSNSDINDDVVKLTDEEMAKCRTGILKWSHKNKDQCEAVSEALQDHDDTNSKTESAKRKQKALLFRRNSCQKCSVIFTTREEYLSHRKYVHPKERRAWCEPCGRRFPDTNLLQLHNMEHHWREGMKMAKKYTCSESGCSFSTFIYATWHKHKSVHHAEPRVCEICGKTLKNEFTLKQHLENMHTRTTAYPCDVCGKNFTTKGNMKAHREARHMDKTDREKLVCQWCAFVCWCKSSMSEHLLLKHNELLPARKIYQCETCDFKTTIQTKLKDHTREHNAMERPECDTCRRTYKSIKLLNRHKKIHNNTAKVTRCIYCEYTTLHGVGTLSNHLKFKHKDKDPKPWQCDECPHRAITRESIVHHLQYVHKRDPESYTGHVSVQSAADSTVGVCAGRDIPTPVAPTSQAPPSLEVSSHVQQPTPGLHSDKGLSHSSGSDALHMMTYSLHSSSPEFASRHFQSGLADTVDAGPADSMLIDSSAISSTLKHATSLVETSRCFASGQKQATVGTVSTALSDQDTIQPCAVVAAPQDYRQLGGTGLMTRQDRAPSTQPVFMPVGY